MFGDKCTIIRGDRRRKRKILGLVLLCYRLVDRYHVLVFRSKSDARDATPMIDNFLTEKFSLKVL